MPTPTRAPWLSLPEIKTLLPDPCEEEEEKTLSLLSQATPACAMEKAQEAQSTLSISYPGDPVAPLLSHMVLYQFDWTLQRNPPRYSWKGPLLSGSVDLLLP